MVKSDWRTFHWNPYLASGVPGWGSSASAVLSAVTGRTDRRVSVHTEGGTSEFLWREDDEMLLTGRADLAFCGTWDR